MDSLLVYLYFCIRTDFLVLNQLRHKEEKISIQKMIKVKLIGYKLLKPCLSMWLSLLVKNFRKWINCGVLVQGPRGVQGPPGPTGKPGKRVRLASVCIARSSDVIGSSVVFSSVLVGKY